MSIRHYGLSLALAASLSLPLAGCGSDRPASAATGAPTTRQAAAIDPYDTTDETIWTVLGLAKRASQRNIGPQTGVSVSPILWQAVLDTLNFAGTSSEDPMTGLVETKWYSPAGKPDERLRVSAFILSRALRSDSLAVTIERQTRGTDGAWHDEPVARETVAELENAILLRARHIHAERYRNTMYN